LFKKISKVVLKVIKPFPRIPILDRLERLKNLQDPDYGLGIGELILSRGYQVESHYITTQSGYILHLFRIIHPKLKSYQLKKPILLWHGVIGSGIQFLINSPGGNYDEPEQKFAGNNLGFELAKHGYDVWLMNARGNYYSKNHTFLDPDKDYKRYWNFSLDELVSEDAPLAIDYILEKTNRRKIGWIGWSHGSAVGLCALAQHPRLNEIIEPYIGLAPVLAFGGGTYPNLLWHMHWVWGPRYKLHGDGNYLPDALFPPLGLDIFCVVEPTWCSIILDSLTGGETNYNKSRIFLYLDMGTMALSEKLWRGWTQQFQTGKTVKKFDYGKEGNMKMYGSYEAPTYPLQNITSRSIYFFWCDLDGEVGPTDVNTLRNTLKTPFTEFHMTDHKWGHADFAWGRQSGMLINTPIIQILDSIDKYGESVLPEKWTHFELGNDTVKPFY